MIYRRLGRTGLEVSLLSLGTGGPNQFGQASGVPESDIHRLVHRALDLGINLFDSSPGYGDSELILGRALKGVPRDHYLVSTKMRIDAGMWDDVVTPEAVVKSVENSLRRLQVSELDVFLVAGWPKPRAYERIIDELLPVLDRLRQQGRFRYLGASEASRYDGAHEWLARGLRDDLFDVVMVAYNMINQCAEREVFPLCRKNDVGTMIIFAVRKLFNRPERLKEVIAALQKRSLIAQGALPVDDPLGWVLGDGADSLIDAAYKFCAGNEDVSTVLTGTNSIDHLQENLGAVSGPPLAEEMVEQLRFLFQGIAQPIGN